nr:scavenger receptor 2 [Harmonia axyridis]
MKFSLFNYKQIISDGVYEVNSGMIDISKIGEIEQWNYSNYTSLWDENLMNNTCNQIKGSDGTLFPPHLSEDSSLSIFSTDICRSVSIVYNRTDTYKGIEGYVYKTDPNLFYSSVDDPTKDCYCSLKKGTLDENGQKSCFLDGVIDIYPCLGLPVLVSQPHFLNADKKYLQNLEGLHPDPEKHEIYVLLDKYTGIPLQAHERVQLNIILRPSESFDSSKNFARTILPLVWIDMGLDLPDSGIDLLNSLLYDTLTLVNISKWLFIGISLCLTIFACILLELHLYSK